MKRIIIWGRENGRASQQHNIIICFPFPPIITTRVEPTVIVGNQQDVGRLFSINKTTHH